MNKHKWNKEIKAWTDATMEAMLYGHGFIRISYTGNQLEVASVKPEEYEDITELMKFIKENKIETT